MKILICGGSSLLGKYLDKTSSNDCEVDLTFFSNHIPGRTMYHLDICHQSQVNYVFSRVKPDVVIHCSAIGSVDFAESHFSETHMVNVIGTRNVVKACQDFGCKLVYISTNAVYSGNEPPYNEYSDRHPVNRYGSIKKEAEDVVLSSNNWIIIRPFMLYGWPYLGGRQNWMTTIINKLSEGKEVHLVDDVYWQPTSAKDCAESIWKLIDNKNEIYNVAADDKMTLFEFGLKVARIWGYDLSLIQPIASSSLKIALRPKDTQFNLDKIHSLDIRLDGVEEGLKYMKESK